MRWQCFLVSVLLTFSACDTNEPEERNLLAGTWMTAKLDGKNWEANRPVIALVTPRLVLDSDSFFSYLISGSQSNGSSFDLLSISMVLDEDGNLSELYPGMITYSKDGTLNLSLDNPGSSDSNTMRITEQTDSTITGSFSGRIVFGDGESDPIEVKDGAFSAKLLKRSLPPLP